MEEKDYKTGSVVFREGDAGSAMYIVKSGKVKIVKKGKEVEKTLAVFGPGEFFGEMAIITGNLRSASAVVEENARLQTMSRQDFLGMIQCQRKEDSLAMGVIEKLCNRLQETDRQIENLLIGDHLNRVADALSGADSGLTVGDLAGRMGLHGDRVRDVLRKLEAAGVLSTEDGRIKAIDRKKLDRYRETQTRVVDVRGEDDTLRTHRLLKSAGKGTWLAIITDSSALEGQIRRLSESAGHKVLDSVAVGQGEWQVTVEI